MVESANPCDHVGENSDDPLPTTMKSDSQKTKDMARGSRKYHARPALGD
jgi:hypothetical protein